MNGDDPILTATPDSAPAEAAEQVTPAVSETPAAGQEPTTTTPESSQTDGEDKPILEPEQAEEVNEFSGAPEGYEDFDMPENFTLDEAGKAEASELFRKLNLSQKGAQALVDAWVDKVKVLQESEVAKLADQRKAWRSELRNSPSFATDRAMAQKGIKAVVKTEAERALFQDTWLSDHPAVFSLFARIGSMLGEDSPVPAGSANPEQNVNRLRFPID